MSKKLKDMNIVEFESHVFGNSRNNISDEELTEIIDVAWEKNQDYKKENLLFVLMTEQNTRNSTKTEKNSFRISMASLVVAIISLLAALLK